jgi:transcriptional regulator with XRE-family HTH domain
MALLVGPQLRAGRAMAGIGQEALAELSGVGANTIRRLEAAEGPLPTRLSTVQALQRALGARGVEFTGGDEPGVRLRKPTPAAA